MYVYLNMYTKMKDNTFLSPTKKCFKMLALLNIINMYLILKCYLSLYPYCFPRFIVSMIHVILEHN